MYQLHTTQDVMAEVLYRKRRKYPEASGKVMTDIHDSLESNIDEILGDFDATVPYEGTDPNDLHVHAAAVSCGARILLTADGGFEPSDSTPYEVYSCDDFFLLVNDSAPRTVQRVIVQQSKYWADRAKNTGEPSKTLAQALRDAGCPEFATVVEGHQRTMFPPPLKKRQRPASRRR
jgi:hypothetical protein